jgi:putative aminopeptidase FrvX
LPARAGPIIASNVGLRTVDVGVASLSMHSIRETVGVDDISNSFILFREFFKSFGELDAKCNFRPLRVCKPCGPPPSAIA